MTTPAPATLSTGIASVGAGLSLPEITISLWFISPVSSAVGSPRLAYFQNVASAGVPAAGFWIIFIDFIVQLTAWLCGEGRVMRPDPASMSGPEGSISMSLPELAGFMQKLKNGVVELPERAESTVGQVTRPGVQVLSPAYLTLYLLVSGMVSTRPGAPMLSIFVPLISFKGLVGGLPIIIMGLISVILVRAVVPPGSSGLLPDAEAGQEPMFQLNTKELIQMLRGYGKYFK